MADDRHRTYRQPADAAPCEQHHLRLQQLEKTSHEHAERITTTERALADGRVQFAEISKDIQGVTKALEHLATRLDDRFARDGIKWGAETGKAAIFWLVPLIGGAILWAVVHSTTIAAVHP